ncbi:MAG TPA: hypothetical protein VI229_00190 [Burkholderiales bacterium]
MRSHTTFHFQADDPADSEIYRSLQEVINIMSVGTPEPGQKVTENDLEGDEAKAVRALFHGITLEQIHIAFEALLRKCTDIMRRHVQTDTLYSRSVVKQQMDCATRLMAAYVYMTIAATRIR